MYENKPKRSWSGFQYVVLVVLAILTAWFVVRPIGQRVQQTFQQLDSAFEQGKH